MHQHSTREVVPAEGKVITRLFRLYTDDRLSPRKIAHVLNADRLPAPTPRQKGRLRAWSGPTVRSILLRPSSRLIVGDRLWARVQQEFSRPLDNNPTRRPPGRGEGKYLLTGLAVCALCGGPLIALKRNLHTTVYRCGTRHQRGPTACGNSLAMPVGVVDMAVLEAVEHDFLRPDVLNPVVDAVVRESLAEMQETPDRRTTLTTDLAQIEAELAHYAGSVASVGPLPSLLSEIMAREDQKARLLAALQSQSPKQTKRVSRVDVARIKRELKDILEGWVETLYGETARGILQALLTSRLVFTPEVDQEGGAFYRFTGQGAFSPVFDGLTGIMTLQSRS